MDDINKLTVETMTRRHEGEPLVVEPEPELCRCCQRVLLLWEGRCWNCGAIVITRKAA